MGRKKEPPKLMPVSMGTYGTCPEGHQTVKADAGEDRRGKYIDLWCTTPRCSSKQVRLRRAADGQIIATEEIRYAR